jgi:hypothetical protein
MLSVHPILYLIIVIKFGEGHKLWSASLCNLHPPVTSSLLKKKRRQSCLCNSLWRPIGLWDVEAPTFSRQSAHRWRSLFTPSKIPGTHFCWRPSGPQGHSAAGRIRLIEYNDIIGNWTRNLAACSIVSQPTMVPRAPFLPLRPWYSP